MSTAVGPRAHVVEDGSGRARKPRLLLDALDDPVAYTPFGISRSALLASVERLDREFDDVEVLPVCADFTQPVPLPRPAREAEHALVFFPGSTLGNFTHAESLRLLRAMRETMGERGEIGRAHAELQSLMRISYAVFCLKKKNNISIDYT